MPAQVLTAIQENALGAMTEIGLFQSKSEALRASVAALLDAMPTERRTAIAIAMYRKGDASISAASIVAGIPFRAMRDHLEDEGILRLGFADPAHSVKAGKKLAKALR